MFRFLTSLFSTKSDRVHARPQTDPEWERGREIQDHVQAMADGPDPVGELLKTLEDQDVLVRRHAVGQLADTCREIMRRKEETDQTKTAVTEIARLLVTDSDEIVHNNVGEALCHNGCPDPSLVMVSLVEATTSEHASARAAAATCLGQFSKEASEAVPNLVELLRDPEQRVRLSSVRALRMIGPAAEDAVPLLIDFLKSPCLDERAAAAQAISTIGGDAEIVLPALLEALADSENYLPAGSNRDVFLPESFMEPGQIQYKNGNYPVTKMFAGSLGDWWKADWMPSRIFRSFLRSVET